MDTKVRATLHSLKSPLKPEKDKVGMQEKKRMMMDSEKAAGGIGSVRERRMALQQDVEKLKKELRREENVHRALERAFTRPLGALPRLPPYLPPKTLELLAEVAVLEEEVVRLEEQVVHFRKGLYQEAVCISSSKKNTDNSADVSHPCQENRSCITSMKNKQRSPKLEAQNLRTAMKTCNEYRPTEKSLDPRKLQQQEVLSADHEAAEGTAPVAPEQVTSGDESPNKISESLVKCLSNIFLRLSSRKRRITVDTLPSLTGFDFHGSFERAGIKDPYDICAEDGNRDIGPYKHFFAVDAVSINLNRTTHAVFLVHRLKILLGKLASVDLQGLTHQEKLAFWINTYNSCMMNVFLDYGIPESPEMVVELMQKATINVGGHSLNALTIEHFILRLSDYSKYSLAKGAKNDETTVRSMFGLELSEPLVTFALSCGNWSSPAVRVFTASEVENELEVAKREYLQAAVGISTAKKMVSIPKVLDWYLVDFAKDLESLLDWICLQLPSELGKKANMCLDGAKTDPLSKSVKIRPYEFSFRYLFRR